jgi:hypothetical protein
MGGTERMIQTARKKDLNDPLLEIHCSEATGPPRGR